MRRTKRTHKEEIEAIHLWLAVGFTKEQIAEGFGTTVNTVVGHKYRGKMTKELQAILNQPKHRNEPIA